MKITFILQSVSDIDETTRPVLDLANALAASHDVRIASVFGGKGEAVLGVSNLVTILPLSETVFEAGDLVEKWSHQPSELIPPDETSYRRYSRADDERLRRFLTGCDSDVIIGTHPGLNLCVARLAPDRAAKIAQERRTHSEIPAGVRDGMREYYGRIDAVVTLTEADATAFRESLEHPGLLILAIPNAVPSTALPPSHTDSRIVMASGRLSEANRYDVLIRAYARVATDFPDWQLRIHGVGPLRRALQRLIGELGLYNHVFLMGRTDLMQAEWVKAALAVSTSQRDPLGLSLIQAMRAGVPVIATDCPVAPGEIIRNGVDGYLVPMQDIEAISRALAACMGSSLQRKAVGASALSSSRRFDPERITSRYEELFAKITAGQRASIARLARFTQSLLRPGQTGAVPAFNPPLPHSGSATCTVGVDGGITVRPALSHNGQAVFLRNRRRDAPRETSWLRFPCRTAPGVAKALPPAATIGPVDILRLGEGRWDLFTIDEDGTRTRLTANVIDSRGALQAALCQHDGEVTHAVPYATEDGHLSIRSWRRLHHAEVTGIDYQHAAVVVHGRYMGEWDEGNAPQAVLQRRQQPRSALALPDVTFHERVFHCRIPVDELMHRRILREENWDLFLSDETRNRKSRVGRLLDDSPNRKLTHRYPELVVEEPGAIDLFCYSEHASRVAVRPYYTADNDLSVVVTELE